jgi:hypothetical protein
VPAGARPRCEECTARRVQPWAGLRAGSLLPDPAAPYHAPVRDPIRLLAAAALATVLGAGAGTGRAAPSSSDADARAWNQWGGNAGRTFSCEAEPVTRVPREIWSRSIGSEPGSGPVSWEGIVYWLEKGRLHATSLADGKSLANTGVSDSPSGTLAVVRGMVVVADRNALRGFQLQPSGMTLRWIVRDLFSGSPAVVGGVLYMKSLGGSLMGYQGATGKSVGGSWRLPAREEFAIATEGPEPWAAGVDHVRSARSTASTLQLRIAGPGAPEWSEDSGHLGVIEDEDPALSSILSRIPPHGDRPGGWIYRSGAAIKGKKEDARTSILSDTGLDGGLLPIDLGATIHRGSAIGFHRDGRLISATSDGRFLELLAPGSLPRGARPGAATRAGSVAYFGNWALDLDTRRVLWTSKEIPEGATLLPLGDRYLVARTADGRIVALTDRPVADDAPGAATGPEAAQAPALPPPLGGDGLLLEDGSTVDGTVEALPGDRFRVSPSAGGAAQELDARRVLLARADGRILHRGRESGILGRWRQTLHPAAREVLLGLHERLARRGLHDLAAATLEDARRFGLSEGAFSEATRRALGMKAAALPDRARAALEPEIRKERGLLQDRFLEGAAWCAARGFPAAAACLLSEGDRVRPGDPRIATAAAALVPAEFPWFGEPGGPELWMRWAAEIVLADASFVPASGPIREAVRSRFWGPGERLVVLRTPNVLFWSRSLDPLVVGRCVRNAETTCRALSLLLGEDAVVGASRDADRMNVRLHAREEEYRIEEKEGGIPEGSTAGYFSPGDGLSRFFVQGKSARDPLGRDLYTVLAHELTHHFLEMRWRPNLGRRGGAGPRSPGYWAIEGVARFVEDQVVEMERRGMRFDDWTVPSLDATVQARAAGHVREPHRFFGITQEAFQGMDSRELLRVRLRNTLEGQILSARNLFYEQSGAMVFFLVQERGAESRAAFFRYLAAVYAGKTSATPWKDLGFESAGDFDRRFLAYLDGMR